MGWYAYGGYGQSIIAKNAFHFTRCLGFVEYLHVSPHSPPSGNVVTCFFSASFGKQVVAQADLTLLRKAYEGTKTTTPSGTKPTVDSMTAPNSVICHVSLDTSPRNG